MYPAPPVTNTVRREVLVDGAGVAKATVEVAKSDRMTVKSIRQRLSIFVLKLKWISIS
jgi:hypothetical protein